MAPQVFELVRVTLASLLLDVGRGQTVSHDDCLEAERLMTESMPILLEQGWTYLVPTAADTLADALMRLARPSEALQVASHGLQFAESDPLSLALLHVWVAEAALASGKHATAAQACHAFRDLVEAEGRGHVDRMLATAALGYPDNDPFGRIEQFEAALLRESL